MNTGFEDNLKVATNSLRAAQKTLIHEIKNYPTPIAGCDVQFNHLLAERQKVLAAIQSLDEIVFVPTPRSPSPATGVESR